MLDRTCDRLGCGRRARFLAGGPGLSDAPVVSRSPNTTCCDVGSRAPTVSAGDTGGAWSFPFVFRTIRFLPPAVGTEGYQGRP